MHNNRRDFLKYSSLAGIYLAGSSILPATASDLSKKENSSLNSMENDDLSIIGLYGPWAASLLDKELPTLSFRRPEFKDLKNWKEAANTRLLERLAIPEIPGTPEVTVKNEYSYDGLHIEELSWQLPFGRPTEAILLKPLNQKGPLPGILAFHDHGGNKYFGTKKITKTSDQQLPMMKAHQKDYYEGFAWANEIAKRGYVVLVSDTFHFASRRVMLQDVPAHLRRGLSDPAPDDVKGVSAYNDWAGNHEHIMAKSLFSAGTTWPAVFFAEDRKALDVLSSREDVDSNNLGCGGLSGGGLRTVFMGGIDPRIKCAVCVGFMSTWKEFMYSKSYTHTWMTYVPLLPKELDFPEILGLRVPLPTYVLNDEDDQLYTMPEMKKADNILKEVYQKAGAEDNYKSSYYPGPHKFDKKMQADAFQWFDKWLKR